MDNEGQLALAVNNDNEMEVSQSPQSPEAIKDALIAAYGEPEVKPAYKVPTWDEIEEGHLLVYKTSSSSGWRHAVVHEKFDTFFILKTREGQHSLIQRGQENDDDIVWVIHKDELLLSGIKKRSWRRLWFKPRNRAWTFQTKKTID